MREKFSTSINKWAEFRVKKEKVIDRYIHMLKLSKKMRILLINIKIYYVIKKVSDVFKQYKKH